MPTTRSSCCLSSSSALSRLPGTRWFARANASLMITSLSFAPENQAPDRKRISLRTGMGLSGIEMAVPEIGSSRPGRSSSTEIFTRPRRARTLGSDSHAAMAHAGARFKSTAKSVSR